MYTRALLIHRRPAPTLQQVMSSLYIPIASTHARPNYCCVKDLSKLEPGSSRLGPQALATSILVAMSYRKSCVGGPTYRLYKTHFPQALEEVRRKENVSGVKRCVDLDFSNCFLVVYC